MSEVINVIYNILIGTILGLAMIKIGDNIYKSKTKINMKSFLISIGYGIFIYFNYLVVDNMIKAVFIYMCLLIIYRILYKRNIGETLIGPLIGYLIIMVSEITVVGLITLIFKVFSLGSTEVMQNILTTNVIIAILGIVIADKLKIKLNNIVKTVSNSTTLASIGTVALILVILSTLLFNIKVTVYEFNYTFFMSIMLIFGFVIIGIIIIKQNSNVNVLLGKYKDLIEYSKSTEKLMEEYRINNHEHINQLVIIKSLLKKTNKEVDEYLDNLLKIKNQDKKFYWINELKYLPFDGLKGFLNYKITEIKEDNIEVEIHVSKELEKINEKKFKENTKTDFYNAIGILLDNARESSKESKRKTVIINVYNTEKEIIVEIANTYHGTIDIDKISSEGYSSKGKNRGNGLKILRQILEKNQFIRNDTIVNNDYFIQKIILKIPFSK